MQNLNPIRELISEGNLKEALSRLLNLLDSNDRHTRKLRDGVIILHSKFQDLSRKETLGLIETEDALREKAQINDALLSLMGDIETGPALAPEPTRTSLSKRWWLLLLLLPAAALMVFWKQLFGPQTPGPDSANPGIDVYVANFQIEPGAVKANKDMTVSFEVINKGSVAAKNVHVQWWANIQDGHPAWEENIASLEPGQSKSYTIPHKWTVVESNLKCRLRAESEGGIADLDPADNEISPALASEIVTTVTVTPPPPPPGSPKCNLSVIDWRWAPDPIVPGKAVRVVFVVKNHGPNRASNFTVEWFSNIQAAPKTWYHQTIEAGGTRQYVIEAFTYPGAPATSLSTKIRLDPQQTLPETDRSDNDLTRTLSFQAVAAPDLAISSWTIGANDVINTHMTNTVKIKIVNNGNATAYNFKVAFWENAQQMSVTKTWPVPSLAPGKTWEQSFSNSWAGYDNLEKISAKIVVDIDKTTGDANMQDNSKIKSFKVVSNIVVLPPGGPGGLTLTPIDLSVAEFSWKPSPIPANQDIKIKIVIKNTGPRSAKNFKVQWFADETFSASSQSLLIDELQANGTRVWEFPFRWYTMNKSSWTSKVVIDPANAVPESNENNNTAKKEMKGVQ